MILKVVRHHSVPVGGCLSHFQQAYSLLEVFKLICLKALAGSVSAARDWRSLGHRASQGASNGLSRANLHGQCLQHCSSSLGDAVAIVVGELWALFRNKFVPVGAFYLQEVGAQSP